MASLLKSSRFVVSSLRYSWLKVERVRLKYVSVHSKNWNEGISCSALFATKKFSTANEGVMTRDLLEKSIHQLDLDARYKHKINLRDVEEILAALRHWGAINYQNSLILIHCCGSVTLEADFKKKIDLLQELMVFIEKSGIELQISHYNALLATYLENEHEFSPSEFLEDLKKKNLNPNSVTYQRLLKAFCLQGNITGASELLEKMKAEEINLNEDIFNSLILGHCQVNDIPSALAILDLMHAKGVDSTSETYVNLLCGYAKNGQINEMRKIFDDCEKRGILFFDKDILRIVYTLAVNHHSQFVDEVLKKLKKQFGYQAEARLFILKLLQKNMDSVAFKIFETARTNSEVSNDWRRSGKFLIQYFAQCRPVDQILQVCQQLESKGEMGTSLSYAVKEVLLLDDDSKALALFSAMKEKKLPVRSHFFWPLLIRASEKGNDALMEALGKMKSMKVSRCSLTCSRIVYNYYKFGEDWLADIEKLHECGVDREEIGHSMFKSFLSKENTEDALKLASSMHFSTKKAPLSFLVNHLVNSNNVEFFVKAVYVFLHDAHLLASSCAGESGSSVEDSSSSDSESEDVASDSFSEERLFSKYVMRELTKHCDETLLVQVLQKMSEEKMCLISAETSEEMKKKFGSGKVADLIDKLSEDFSQIVFDNNILKAKESRRHAKNESIDDFSQMFELIRNERIDDAVTRCEAYLSKSVEDMSEWKQKRFKSFMMNVAKTGNYEAVKKIFDLAVERKVIGPRNFFPLVSALVTRGELEKATDLFCQKVLETNCRSSWPSLVSKLIEVQKADLLQKVTDTMTKLEDEAFSIGMLISQFARLGKVREIKKLLDSRGFMLPRKSVDLACRWLFAKGSVEGFENLLTATNKAVQINRMNIYLFLLRLHIREGNVDKAKALWVHLDEDNLSPSGVFLKELTRFLEEKGEPVPFVVNAKKAGEND